MLQLLAERKICFGPCYFSTPSFHHMPPKTDAVQSQNTIGPMCCFSRNMKSGKSLRCFISQLFPIVLVGELNPKPARLVFPAYVFLWATCVDVDHQKGCCPVAPCAVWSSRAPGFSCWDFL